MFFLVLLRFLSTGFKLFDFVFDFSISSTSFNRLSIIMISISVWLTKMYLFFDRGFDFECRHLYSLVTGYKSNTDFDYSMISILVSRIDFDF